MPSGRDRSSRQAARERIAARRAAEQEKADAARRRRTRLVSAVAVAAVVVLAVVVAVVVQSARTDTGGGPAPANTAGGTGFALGPADAPVTVDVYEDYLCPACRAFEADASDELAGLVERGDARVVVHPVAILDRLSADDYSTRAANAAAVVADAAGAEAFRQFSDLLFAEQPAEGGPGLSDDELVDLAARVGAAGDAVEAGIRELRYGDWVARVTDEASQAGLRGTPWVLVDGEPLEVPTAEALTAAVEAAAP